MKIIKTIFCTLIFLITATTTQAQFFEKLQKKAEEKIAREAERRAQRRVDRKIDKTFDKAEDGIDGKLKKKKKSKTKTQTLPASYSFEWEYTLKMESKAKKKGRDIGDIKVVYLLNPNSSAFGSKFEMSGKNEMVENMLTIIDLESEINIMLMEMNGQKIIQKMPSISNEDIDESLEEQETKDYTIVKTDIKTILGYSCQGFKITNKDGVTNMYFAKNTPVSFNNNLSGNSKIKMKGFNPSWSKEFKNGLMMEMDFKSSKKEKYNIKMTCVSLENKFFTINLSEYKVF